MGVEEQLAGQRNHHLDHIGFDHGLTNIAFSVLVRTHRTVGQDDAGAAAGLEVKQHVLQPGVVGIALRRRTVGPAWITVQASMPPVADIERRVGQDEVGAQV
ncbi:hypothetical protein D3C87_1608780 [compost metagenome]